MIGQYQSFNQALSTEIARISEFKTNHGLKAFILIAIYFISLMSFSVNGDEGKNAGFIFMQKALKDITQLPEILLIPLAILLTIIYFIWMWLVLSLSFDTYMKQTKINQFDIIKRRLREKLSYLLEVLFWFQTPLLSLNFRLLAINSTGWRAVPIINILLQSSFCFIYIYFYRSYKFNQQGLYRIYNAIEYFKFLGIIFVIILEQWQQQILPHVCFILAKIILLDLIIHLPFGYRSENEFYLFGCSAFFAYSILGVGRETFTYINPNNIFETFLFLQPILYIIGRQLQQMQRKKVLDNNKYGRLSDPIIMCQQIETLIEFVEQGRDDPYQFLQAIYLLKFHEKNCLDSSCDCKEQRDKENQESHSMTHKSSFHSKTALLSQNDKQSGTQNEMSQQLKTIKDLSNNDLKKPEEFTDPNKQMIILAQRVNNISKPMKFIRNHSIDEDLVSKFIRRQFNLAIQGLSFQQNLESVEYLSLKYISFMYSFKQNSPQSLTKLRQIQSRNANFSYFFNHICKVTEQFLIDSILNQHQEQIETQFSMNVAEVWRLEIVKEIIITMIVQVIKKKIKLWDNLCNGEISSMDKLLNTVIDISKQVEASKTRTDQILEDFSQTVQKSYSYYLKYQCFRALFYDSDYRKAVLYQRKVEDSWQVSKSAGKEGIIGNYQWLSGNMITLEVSIGVMCGQIIKGVNQRLVDFLSFGNNDDMMTQLRIRGTPAQQNSHTQNLFVASLMPPFLTSSHQFFIQRFINRGYTSYYNNPILSFLSDAQGFIFPVNVHLSFNFQNTSDFSILGSIVKKNDDNDYIIFDEWGRILGVSMKTFQKLILKGALDEFGVISYLPQNIKNNQKANLIKQNLINKIARDENAKFFKKTITMNQTNNSKSTKRENRRTYQKQSDILLQFGSVQHFLPQIGKIMTELISKEIFKKLQKESQNQFNKLMEQDNQQAELNKQASNLFQKQVSMMLEKQTSQLSANQLSSNLLDKQQYRNFIINSFLDSNHLLKKECQLLQDEKVTLFVPKNYNELIEYFNDAGERFQDNRGEFENKSIKRQQIQNKHNPIKQQQNCYHLFDADFQDFIDNKVRKYYSKSLLRQAIEDKAAKFVDMVRYKSTISVDVGLGGVSEEDQFLYFVCKLSNLNLMQAKRKDIIKLHLKKDKNMQFDGDENLRRSLIQSQDSIRDDNQRKVSKTMSFGQQESIKPIDEKGKFPFYKPQEQKNSQGLIQLTPKQQPQRENIFSMSGGQAVISLTIPQSRTYTVNASEDNTPQISGKLNDSSFDLDNSMKESLINVNTNNMNFVPKLGLPPLQRQNSAEKLRLSQVKQEEQISEQPKKKKFRFLEKMEKAFMENRKKNETIQKQNNSLLSPEDRRSSLSLLSPGSSSNNIFGIMFSRLNLRRVSNVDFKNDTFENNDQEMKESEEQSEKKDDGKTYSGSQSMSSNNISRDDAQDDEEDLVNRNDELVNIFEVMSQASNHQSIKSISAIAMATNISQRCLSYMPRQAQSLQVFKLILVSLNIAGIITLILATQDYFNYINVDYLSLYVNNYYKYSVIALQSANQILQPKIINFSYTLNNSLFIDLINTCYQNNNYINDQWYRNIQEMNDAIQFPMQLSSLINVPLYYQINSLSDLLTKDKIELDYLKSLNTFNWNNQSDYSSLNRSLDYLFSRMVYKYLLVQQMSLQLQTYKQNQVDSKSQLIIILMGIFCGLHILVILFIIPFIKQINDIYQRVLQILSRVNIEESVDEIKKLTLCQHLLEANDDTWVTQNQVKLVFYNKSKQLDLEVKYRRPQKGKDTGFHLKLSDTQLSLWKDMLLYITISAISIGYLIFAIIMIQVIISIKQKKKTQINSFNLYIQQHNNAVQASIYVSSLISKLSITPERYIQINKAYIPSQITLWQLQQNGSISYLLQTINSDSTFITQFKSQISNYLETINLDDQYDHNNSKINVNAQNINQRFQTLSQLTTLEEMNHLLQDNICYYTLESICPQQQQIDYFNTGLIGALDLLTKFTFNYNAFLSNYTSIQFGNTSIDSTTLQYYNTQDFELIVAYGQNVLSTSFNRLLSLMQEYLLDKKQIKSELVHRLFLGIGIPIMIFTFFLAILEMYVLKKKVQRVMLAVTYLPTFKFQEKTILSLIKAVLKM